MGILSFLLGYVFLLICWLILNLFFYALSVATNKSFFFIPFTLNTILNWLVEIYFVIYPYYFLFTIVKANWGTWWIVILSFLIGLILIFFLMGFWRTIVNFLIYPIGMITMLFSGKVIEKLANKEDDSDYEVVSPEGKVIEMVHSSSKTDKKLATYFIIDYLINLARILLDNQRYSVNGVFGYIFTPIFFVVQNVIIFGIIVGIFNLIKHKKFLYGGFKAFLATTFKVDIIVAVVAQILSMIVFIFIP